MREKTPAFFFYKQGLTILYYNHDNATKIRKGDKNANEKVC
jgi:hypothetical protein